MDIISYLLAKKAYDLAYSIHGRMTNAEINLIKSNFKFNALLQSSRYNLHNMVIDTFEDSGGLDLSQGAPTILDGALTPIDKLDLSGGAGGQSGQTVYTAPNGVVVTSSAPVYGNNYGYYWMTYLFDNIITMAQTQYTTYWLTNSSGNQTLTFDFAAIGAQHINYINVYPRCRDDATSNYRILASDDGTNWVEVVPWVTVNTSTPYGTKNTHNISMVTKYVRFELTRNDRYGVTLSEIEFFVSGNDTAITKSEIVNMSELLFVAEYTGNVQFYISTDDGVTWQQIYNEQLIKMSAASIRFKFVLDNNAMMYAYGYAYR
jgi:hypothetical protein